MKLLFNKQYSPIALIFCLLGITFLPACTDHSQAMQVMQITKPGSIRKDGMLNFVHPGKAVKASIFIEIADTPDTQKKGLMGRGALDDNSGMLFVYEHTEPRKFWMKNTPVPLDIIFAGEDGCIVNIVESASPMSERRYRSAGPVKYVVEVRAGFVKRFQIDTDTCIQWRYICKKQATPGPTRASEKAFNKMRVGVHSPLLVQI